MKIHDISVSIENGMPVYSGNPAVKISQFNEIPKNSSNISLIEMGSHTGTHLDAPKHAIEGAGGIDALPLENFIGDAKVFDLNYLKSGDAVKISDIEDREISAGDMVLFKTSNSDRGYAEFYTDFVYVDGDTAEYLANKGVKLVGIDYLSIKQKGSKDNRPHTALLSKNIAILEGIDLSNVTEGKYELVCLPLKIKDADGSPTRAVLIER